MYTFAYDYESDTDTQSVTHTVHAEADLTELLNAFGFFLQAAGFTYVTGLTANKGDDDLTTSVTF